jgi:hypothetical protein
MSHFASSSSLLGTKNASSVGGFCRSPSDHSENFRNPRGAPDKGPTTVLYGAREGQQKHPSANQSVEAAPTIVNPAKTLIEGRIYTLTGMFSQLSLAHEPMK